VAVGEGHSSPVIAGAHLYVMARQEGREVCLCLRADTGEEVWRHAYEQPFLPHPSAQAAGSGPKSTPAVNGDRVYMLGVDGKLHCFDAPTGRLLWQHDLAAEFWGVEKDEEGLDPWRPVFGVSASPLVDGGRVVLPVGGKKAGGVTAFDKRTGRLVWRALEDRASYASPVAAGLAGVHQVVAFTGRRLVGLGAASGQLLWDFPYDIPYGETIVTPVVWGNLVVACSANKPAVALRIEQRAGKFQRALAWQNKALRSSMSTPVAYGGHLYGLADGGRLVCIELTGGKTAWAGGSFGTYASLVVASGQLLVLGTNGELHVLEPTPRAFTPRARLALSEAGETWAHLAVSGSRLFLKDKRHVLCYEFKPEKE
jgi:outer membrane protein assembly factor BamB